MTGARSENIVDVEIILKEQKFNPILDRVWETPILDGGQKASPPQDNSAIWCLTTMKLGRNMCRPKTFQNNQNN